MTMQSLDLGRIFGSGTVQGNVLQPHARDHARLVLLDIADDNASGVINRAAVARVIHQWVTSCKSEVETGRSGPFCSIHLSSRAIAALGQHPLGDPAFLAGMRSRRHRLNDPAVDEWDKAYRDNALDILLIVADDCPVLLARNVVLIKEVFRGSGISVTAEEQGSKLRRGDLSVEHFGFADGLSQPLRQEIRSSAGSPQIGPLRDPDELLVEDIAGGFGSYLVYRKLEQNVALWEQSILAAARMSGNDPLLIAARLMGRFHDGTPLVSCSSMLGQAVPDNDFDYSDDLNGEKCPYSSHIRKMNNRRGGRSPNVARCSMSYGVRPDLHENGKMFSRPDTGVGMLFMCYQKDIAAGFERLQQIANSSEKPQIGSGVDPVISQPAPKSGSSSTIGRPTAAAPLEFPKTVTLKGGGYFYTPSIPFLERLAQ